MLLPVELIDSRFPPVFNGASIFRDMYAAFITIFVPGLNKA